MARGTASAVIRVQAAVYALYSVQDVQILSK
jgi:hypothetical protein